MRKTALALAAVAALATTAIGPAEARGGRNAAIGFGIAAGALGAVAATSAYHNGYYDNGYGYGYGPRYDDEAIGATSDLPFPVSSEVNEIAEFLQRNGDQVIFSTYQSSPLIAEAQKSPNAPRFNLVIADEAHRCAGKSDTLFGTVLNDALIKSDTGRYVPAKPLRL
jgi:hypothetical protein